MATMSDLAAAKRALGCVSGDRQSPVLVAVSGGLDSMCLLHLLFTWGRERNLAVIAAHFNHQLRETAARDEAFVRDWCMERGIPFVAGSGNVAKAAAEHGQTIEEAARELRYAFLEEQKRALGCAWLLTAHHADDNAETMLLNLLRGTGLRGLSGIPESREGVIRPFLQVTRRELENYAEANNIPHVEDETNELDDAARNVLRHHVLPVLRQLNPKAVENMSRTALLLAEDERTLAGMTDQLMRHADVKQGCAAYLPIQICADYPKAIVGRALWTMMVSVGGHQKDLSASHVEAAWELLQKELGQEISLPYGMVARREAERLCICRRDRLAGAELLPGEPVHWGDYSLTLLECREGEGLAIRANGAVTVSHCVPGERLKLPEASGSRSIKRLCVDRKISLAERDRLPAIYVNGVLAAVWRLGVDQEFLPEDDKDFRFIQITNNLKEKEYEKRDGTGYPEGSGV